MRQLAAVLLLLPLLAFPQGTVVQSTTTTVTGTAGPLVCVMRNSSPALPTGVHVECAVSGSVKMTFDVVVSAGNNGAVGSYSEGSDIVTWLVKLPTEPGPYSWQMVANGVLKTGTF